MSFSSGTVTEGLGCLNLMVYCAISFAEHPTRVRNNFRRLWLNMTQRCHDSSHQDYKDYGGRGIKVCDRWRNSFVLFLADMGVRPHRGSIDRMDVNGDYEPNNCQWATLTEQARNKRSSRFAIFGGKRIHLSELSERSGIGAETLYHRISLGLPEHKVIEKTFSIIRDADGRQTHCDHGHPFDDKNIYWYRGTRNCRACRADNTRRSRQKLKES